MMVCIFAPFSRLVHARQRYRTDRAELGRKPSAVESMLIEAAAAALIDGRRLRAKGQPSFEADRLLARGTSALFALTGSAAACQLIVW
jgi:hypothetical protein